ncbi:MAG: helix-turn-helix transcriptional regulator [Planctomycetes bacterium]|nr:helix-turn-helix transcriptional regulator [Planctomycetota bacterium]
MGDIARPAGTGLPATIVHCSPFVRLAHDFRTGADFTLPARRISDHALLYMKSGAGVFQVASQSTAIRVGMVFIVRPLIVHSFSAAPGTSLHMLNIHFDPVTRSDSATVDYPHDPRRPRRLAADHLLPLVGAGSLPWALQLGNPTAYERLFQDVLRLVSLRDVASVLRLKSAMTDLLAWLHRERDARADAPVDVEVDIDDDDCARAARYIRERHSMPLSIEAIARHVSVSRSSLAKRFKARYRLTLMEYLRNVRIEQAKAHLGYREIPIKALAAALGFANVHHFTRTFTAQVGIPPALYRRVRSIT